MGTASFSNTHRLRPSRSQRDAPRPPPRLLRTRTACAAATPRGANGALLSKRSFLSLAGLVAFEGLAAGPAKPETQTQSESAPVLEGEAPATATAPLPEEEETELLDFEPFLDIEDPVPSKYQRRNSRVGVGEGDNPAYVNAETSSEMIMLDMQEEGSEGKKEIDVDEFLSTPAPLESFKLTEEAEKRLLEEEEARRRALQKASGKRGRIRQLEETRAELAEKQLTLLLKEKELLEKEQTLRVLREELELERKLRALLTKEKEKAEEEAALAMGLCSGASLLP